MIGTTKWVSHIGLEFASIDWFNMVTTNHNFQISLLVLLLLLLSFRRRLRRVSSPVLAWKLAVLYFSHSLAQAYQVVNLPSAFSLLLFPTFSSTQYSLGPIDPQKRLTTGLPSVLVVSDDLWTRMSASTGPYYDLFAPRSYLHCLQLQRYISRPV